MQDNVQIRYSEYKPTRKEFVNSSGFTKSTKFTSAGGANSSSFGQNSRKFNFHPAAPRQLTKFDQDEHKPYPYQSVKSLSKSRSNSNEKEPMRTNNHYVEEPW
jgi:hypothetical protein